MFKMNKLLAKHITRLEPSGMICIFLFLFFNCYTPALLTLPTCLLGGLNAYVKVKTCILTTTEPTVQILQNTKRIKTDEETGSRSDESVQIVIISEALANFFGTSEREMSQAEVLRQVWEYIKVNQLEVGRQVIVICYVIDKTCFFS